MRWLTPFLIAASPLLALVDGSNTEVSAESRLRDYLASSVYPPDLRVLQESDPDLEQVPTIPGNAEACANILRFTGEEAKSGSLIVRFEVLVAVPGAYSFRTYLSENKGKPRLQVITTHELSAGRHQLLFNFYGKALRDFARSGLYRLAGILGEKLPDAQGRQGRLRFFAANYQTRKYDIHTFTDRVWDAPEKRAKVKELENEARSERRRKK